MLHVFREALIRVVGLIKFIAIGLRAGRPDRVASLFGHAYPTVEQCESSGSH